MRILLCTDRYYPAISGVVTSVMTLKKYLEALGNEVKVLTLSDDMNSHVTEDVVYIGSFDANRIYPDVRIKHPVNREHINSLIRWKPDVIHCNTEFSTFFLAKHIYRACHCPMILTYHTDYEDYLHYLALSKKFGRRLLRRYVNYVSSYMTYIICPTGKTASQLVNYGVRSEIRTIPTGLDLERFTKKADEAELDRLRDRFNISRGLPTLVYVGRLGKEKNLTQIVDYLSGYSDKDFQFIIVGDGPDRREIEDQVRSSTIGSKTIFTGMIAQADIPLFYKIGDLFLSASQSETQGLTYIEAMAAGTPILCRKDKCLDGVVDDGVNSYLFETREEFCRKLEYFFLHRDIWPEISRAGPVPGCGQELQAAQVLLLLDLLAPADGPLPLDLADDLKLISQVQTVQKIVHHVREHKFLLHFQLDRSEILSLAIAVYHK